MISQEEADDQCCIPFGEYGKETDIAGHSWPNFYIVCSVCGQPDSCGDCDHTSLSDAEAKYLLGDEKEHHDH